MRVRAFAKINLSLRVLGTRPDGYHELRTVFQSIALHDVLTIRRARGPFQLTCSDAACPADRTNLVWRAAGRVWRAAGRRGAPRDVALHLVKRIPMEAGLGGGSSDAAAAIRALGQMWRVGAARQRAIAAALGADVPYFLEGGTVLGLDRGDVLFPLVDHPPAWVVLVVPAFGVSTKDAYEWLARDRSADSRAPSEGRRRIASLSGGRPNDLQAAVARRHPDIARLVAALGRAGALGAAMSGSGSAVFGLFERRIQAARAAAAVAGRGRTVILTRTVGRATYRRLAAN
jgi:4-diphosphocytidyl-2-C-methyl-D-erythritol kinase